MKSGFVAIIGRANAGKSSILNAILGQKISIVSTKPQNTRDRVTGIYTDEEYQIVFSDTPGIHKPQNLLGEYMAKNISLAVSDVDVILLVIDVKDGFSRGELDLVEKYRNKKTPLVIALNKVDLADYPQVYPAISRLMQLEGIKEILPVSAKLNNNIDKLLEILKGLMPEGPMYYPEGNVTDRSERFMCGEIIREKALLFLNDEIPHGVGVVVTAFKEDKDIEIDADIVLEKDNHKPIVIGKGGSMLKKIGKAARADIEKLLDAHVRLNIFVKVREDWRNNTNTLGDVGYTKKDIL